MDKFEIGQVVKIANKEVAEDWCLREILGDVFIVEQLEVNYDGAVNAIHKAWFVPAAACELLKDVEPGISHSDLVATLVKPGHVIQQELTPVDCHILHMTVGINGESGELLDAIKKAVIYRKPIDRENVVEELGDLEFYMEGLRQGLGITREETIEANIEKLSKRYEGLKYSDTAAKERVDKQ